MLNDQLQSIRLGAHSVIKRAEGPVPPAITPPAPDVSAAPAALGGILGNSARTGLIGAGLGAGAGLAGSMLTEEGRKNKLRNMLLGGLAGGGIGAGAGLMNQPSAGSPVLPDGSDAPVAAINNASRLS